MDPMGVFFALLTAVFWGSYLVPARTMKVTEGRFVLYMGMGVGLIVLILSPWIAGLLSRPADLCLSFMAGVLWSGGNLASIYAVRWIGFSRSAPLFSLSVIINGAIGILIFGELIRTPEKIILLSVGVLLIMIGIVLAISTYHGDEEGPRKRVLFVPAIVTGAVFGIYNAPIRATDVDPTTATSGLLLGMVVTSLLMGGYMSSKEVEGDHERGEGDAAGEGPSPMGKMLIGMMSGGLWAVGTLCSIYSIFLVGLALSYPLFMVNFLIYVGWGIMVFSEIRRRDMWRIASGTVILFLGAVIVAIL